VGKYLTEVATDWYIPFVIRYNIYIDIMIHDFETVKFLSNYVTRCKEERCKTNGQISLNYTQVRGGMHECWAHIRLQQMFELTAAHFHAAMQTFAKLIDSIIDDPLLQCKPDHTAIRHRFRVHSH